MIYTALLSKIYRALFGRLPQAKCEAGDGGLVLVLDGVGGWQLCATSMDYAAAWDKLPHSVKAVDWGHGLWRWHADLTDVGNHEKQGQLVAEAVSRFRTTNPGAPVFLVGKSGGTGVVVRALERLPKDAVYRAILLAPALSPDYDLSKALDAVEKEMVVFWSPLDLVILGLGTRIFGTVDRVRSPAAGLVGFRRLNGGEAADQSPYRKLTQIRWRPSMAKAGYLGGHVGPDNPLFLRKYVMPLLKVDAETDNIAPPVSSAARGAPIS